MIQTVTTFNNVATSIETIGTSETIGSKIVEDQLKTLSKKQELEEVKKPLIPEIIKPSRELTGGPNNDDDENGKKAAIIVTGAIVSAAVKPLAEVAVKSIIDSVKNVIANTKHNANSDVRDVLKQLDKKDVSVDNFDDIINDVPLDIQKNRICKNKGEINKDTFDKITKEAYEGISKSSLPEETKKIIHELQRTTNCYVTRSNKGEGFRLHIFVKDKNGKLVELMVRFMREGSHTNNYARLSVNKHDHYDKFGNRFKKVGDKNTAEGIKLRYNFNKKTHLGLNEFKKDEFIKFVKNILLEIWKGKK